MESIRLGLDLDGTLYNWHYAVYDYHRLYKDYDKSFKDFWDYEAKNFNDETWNFLTSVDVFYSSQIPSDDCFKLLDYVKNKYDIYYITSRPDAVRTTTEQFLKRYNFPFRDNLIFTRNKVNTARRLSLDICIDDMPEQIVPLSGVVDVILVAQPWNKPLWDVYPTAHSLLSVLKLLETTK